MRGFLLVPAGSDLLLKIFRVGGSSGPVTFRRAAGNFGVGVTNPSAGLRAAAGIFRGRVRTEG